MFNIPFETRQRIRDLLVQQVEIHPAEWNIPETVSRVAGLDPTLNQDEVHYVLDDVLDIGPLTLTCLNRVVPRPARD